MSLLNEFKLGADPEFVVMEGSHIVPFVSRPDRYAPWGLDHSGWVIEPHPKPDVSVRELIKNLKVSFNDFATVAPPGKWRAGAYLVAPERTITLGGHVHIDKPASRPEEISALDVFTKHLEALDILPQDECAARRESREHYGRYSDVRNEHGHYEYRTFASWLFSQRVSKICLTATKLIVVDPAAPTEMLGTVARASLTKLKAFFERFKGKDDDVDWILESGMLDKKLIVKPDRDLRDVWSVEPIKENPHWKAAAATTGVDGLITETVRNTVNGVGYRWSVPLGIEHTPFLFSVLRQAILDGPPVQNVWQQGDGGIRYVFRGRIL
jgi:hypothetical protein